MKGFLALFLTSLAFLQVHAATRPNLLFNLADDLRWDAMGCAGNRVIQTPHLDALARDGVLFRNMFVTTAICAASRASISSGLYERTHRYTFGTLPITTRHWEDGYPLALKRAGWPVPVGQQGRSLTPWLRGQVARPATDQENDSAVAELRLYSSHAL